MQFTASAPGAHRIWLRFELDYVGGRYDHGLTAQVQVQVGAEPASPVEVHIGNTAPVLVPNGVRNRTAYRMSRYGGMGRATLRATTEIASLPAAPPGSAVHVAGRVVVADRCTARSLLVFVLPA